MSTNAKALKAEYRRTCTVVPIKTVTVRTPSGHTRDERIRMPRQRCPGAPSLRQFAKNCLADRRDSHHEAARRWLAAKGCRCP